MPATPHTETVVTTIPNCGIDATHGNAYADASLPAVGGSWGNVCRACFNLYGASLGLGKGQRLVLKASA